MISLVVNSMFWASLVALVLTKAADVYTTWRGIDPDGLAERNPLARLFFKRWGVRLGMGFIGLAWVLIVLVTYTGAWLYGTLAYKVAVAGIGSAMAWCQWDVARVNATGRTTLFTRFLSRFYNMFRK